MQLFQWFGAFLTQIAENCGGIGPAVCVFTLIAAVFLFLSTMGEIRSLQLADKIRDLHDRKGMTILLVSHSMEDIARYADRLMVMNHGEKVFDGTPREVFEHYRELEAMGLAAPQVTYLTHALKEHGVPIDEELTTVEEARDAIVRLLKPEQDGSTGRQA